MHPHLVITPLMPSDPAGLSLYMSARKPTLNIDSGSSACVDVVGVLPDDPCFEEALEEGSFLDSCLIALFAAFFASFFAAPFEIFGSAGRSGRIALESMLVTAAGGSEPVEGLPFLRSSASSGGTPPGVVVFIFTSTER